QSHREIRAGGRERPRGGDGAARPVHHRDMARARDIREYPGTRGLQDERLWMTFQLDLSDLPGIGRFENGESPPPGADIQQAGGLVVPDVVRVVATRDPPRDPHGAAVEDRTLAIPTVGDDDLVPIRQECHTLRLSHPRDAEGMSSRPEVDDLERV